jgi:ElaB/YqjD/DUF883 family membrane-anchored ribosome-binding protein
VPTPESNDPMSPPNGEGASSVKSRVSDMGKKAADAIDSRRDRVAEGMDSAAAALRDRAESVTGAGRLAGAADTTADAMESAADYVRDQDVRAMLDDLGRLAKRHPGATLLTAAAVGFLLVRGLSRH